jgi:hypothetical protein
MIFRLIASLLIIASIVCVGAYWLTGNRRHLTFAWRLFQALLIGGLIFFALMFVERVLMRVL